MHHMVRGEGGFNSGSKGKVLRFSLPDRRKRRRIGRRCGHLTNCQIRSGDSTNQTIREREIEVGKKDCISIRLTNNGPYVIDIKGALKEAAQNGFFMNRVSEG